MNRRSFALLPLGGLLVAAGCASNDQPGTSGTVTPARVKSVARLATYLGVTAQLARDPESRPALLRARDGLNAMVAASNWDLATLSAVIAASGVGDTMSSNEGQIVLGALPLFIDLFYGTKVDLRENEYAVAVVTGMAEGFGMALGPAAVAKGRASKLDQLNAEAVRTR